MYFLPQNRQQNPTTLFAFEQRNIFQEGAPQPTETTPIQFKPLDAEGVKENTVKALEALKAARDHDIHSRELKTPQSDAVNPESARAQERAQELKDYIQKLDTATTLLNLIRLDASEIPLKNEVAKLKSINDKFGTNNDGKVLSRTGFENLYKQSEILKDSEDIVKARIASLDPLITQINSQSQSARAPAPAPAPQAAPPLSQINYTFPSANIEEIDGDGGKVKVYKDITPGNILPTGMNPAILDFFPEIRNGEPVNELAQKSLESFIKKQNIPPEELAKRYKGVTDTMSPEFANLIRLEVAQGLQKAESTRQTETIKSALAQNPILGFINSMFGGIIEKFALDDTNLGGFIRSFLKINLPEAKNIKAGDTAEDELFNKNQNEFTERIQKKTSDFSTLTAILSNIKDAEQNTKIQALFTSGVLSSFGKDNKEIKPEDQKRDFLIKDIFARFGENINIDSNIRFNSQANMINFTVNHPKEALFIKRFYNQDKGTIGDAISGISGMFSGKSKENPPTKEDAYANVKEGNLPSSIDVISVGNQVTMSWDKNLGQKGKDGFSSLMGMFGGKTETKN